MRLCWQSFEEGHYTGRTDNKNKNPYPPGSKQSTSWEKGKIVGENTRKENSNAR